MSEATVAAPDLLTVLRTSGPRTKSELASLTGQARSTVSVRLEALTRRGLVVALDEAASTGGRPSTVYSFRYDAAVVLVADVGATHAVLAVTDLAGTVLASENVSTLIAEGPDIVIPRLVQGWEGLLVGLARQASDVMAIGLGLPGPVEHESGIPISPPIMPGWDQVDVPARVRQHIDVPVLVDNDVNVLARGEWTTTCSQESDVLVVKVATGIGAGIISGGRLMRGSQGAAGDIGHIQLAGAGDRLCRCGQVGCLEAVASGRGVAQTLRDEGVDAQSAMDVVALVRAGHPQAIRASRDAGRLIGEALSACVAVLNPSRIIIGGEMADAGEPLLAGIREAVYRRSQPLATRRLQISTVHDPQLGGVVGAALMALDAVLA